MKPALEKLKAKLFSRLTPEHLHLDPSSEEEIKDNVHGSVGGLKYRVVRSADQKEMCVEIQHAKDSEFYIYVFVAEEFGWRTEIASQTIHFGRVDLELKSLVEMARSRNK